MTLFLATGLVLLAVGGKKKGPTDSLPSGGGGKLPPAPSGGGTKPPAIPASAPCAYALELRNPDGSLFEGADGGAAVVPVASGPKSSAAEAEQKAREIGPTLEGPPGSRWVLVGTCEVHGELVRFEQAVIKVFADDGP